MTPDDIDALALMIANHLPGLVLQKPEVEGEPPSKPKNLDRLFVQAGEVRNIILTALNQK
jgi:hypothetical protein